MPKVKRTYKDSLFTDLYYSDRDARKNAAELYNALYDEKLTDITQIQLMRLDNAMIQSLENDISFVVGNRRIILAEHQSTINENMPLRCLLYIAREYEQIIPVRERYKRKAILLPVPEFYVFYNGTDEYPEETDLYLSASYKIKETPSLELRVKVVNINTVKNHPLLGKCKTLREYSALVEKVRAAAGKGSIDKIIDQCIRQGILAEYLTRKRKEVYNMLIAEYDYDMDIAVQREEAEEIGEEIGLKKGKDFGIIGAIEIMLEDGKADKEILQRIQSKYEISEAQAEKYLAEAKRKE